MKTTITRIVITLAMTLAAFLTMERSEAKTSDPMKVFLENKYWDNGEEDGWNYYGDNGLFITNGKLGSGKYVTERVENKLTASLSEVREKIKQYYELMELGVSYHTPSQQFIMLKDSIEKKNIEFDKTIQSLIEKKNRFEDQYLSAQHYIDGLLSDMMSWYYEHLYESELRETPRPIANPVMQPIPTRGSMQNRAYEDYERIFVSFSSDCNIYDFRPLVMTFKYKYIEPFGYFYDIRESYFFEDFDTLCRQQESVTYEGRCEFSDWEDTWSAILSSLAVLKIEYEEIKIAEVPDLDKAEKLMNQVGTCNSLLNEAYTKISEFARTFYPDKIENPLGENSIFYQKYMAALESRDRVDYILANAETIENDFSSKFNSLYIPFKANVEGIESQLAQRIANNGNIFIAPYSYDYILKNEQTDMVEFHECPISTISSDVLLPVEGIRNIGIHLYDNIKNIESHAFFIDGIKSVIVDNPTPPELADDAFTDDVYATATLTVPAGTIQAYESAPGWRRFFKSGVNPGSGVTAVGEENRSDEFYTLEGIRETEPSHGLYIVKGNGKVKKILVP